MRKVVVVIGILATLRSGKLRFLRSGDNPGPPDANGCCNLEVTYESSCN